MKTLRITVLALAALAGAEIGVAGQTSTPAERLGTAKREVARRLSNAYSGPKGSPANLDLLRQEQHQIDKLIDDIESGRRVDPSEIDRAIERLDRGW